MSADYHSTTNRLREIAALHGGGGASGGTHTRFCSECSKGIFSEDGAPSSDNKEILCIDCRGNGRNNKQKGTHIRFDSCTQCEHTFDLSTLTECEAGILLCEGCTAINKTKATHSQYELEGLPQLFDMEEEDYGESSDIFHMLPFFGRIRAMDNMAQDMSLEDAADGNNNMDIDEVGSGLNGGLSGADDTELIDGDDSLLIGDVSGGGGGEEEVTPQGKFLCLLFRHINVGVSNILYTIINTLAIIL